MPTMAKIYHYIEINMASMGYEHYEPPNGAIDYGLWERYQFLAANQLGSHKNLWGIRGYEVTLVWFIRELPVYKKLNLRFAS